MVLRRSQLFVPGNNEHMIRKAALELKPDSVIIDLEDAVPIDGKESARKLIRELLPQLDWKGKELCVRVNDPKTPFFYADIDTVYKIDVVKCIVIPKAEFDLSFVYKATGREIEPLIETARGLLRVEDVIRSEGVTAVSYGAADFALSVGGVVKTYEQSQVLKTLVVSAARAYGVDPIDKVFFDIKDIEGFRKECVEAKSMGFIGKQVIHPSQIPVANEVFSPSEEEINWARRVVEAYEKAVREGRGAISLEGQLVDYVHYKLAKRILDFANQTDS
ncbi:HpcH/HpaI aldolase/citrate lyase family protein [Vulcanisaeta distributa]|uniref:Citrate (Pro-3S)-lyase n=1 Tax=Vulcanisaeta distributa (strain DSM 14429 / JCM 11212 / NBRC 100878 / IC-017) TaxID=572478 RepID=E1QRP4_VULDI|nr:CoA ester lyase [Vulcanisaeta distributa]ADN49419.1 Citrate (pro-3S)-lyase [Vulcanisaeta distributa DSM 14429]